MQTSTSSHTLASFVSRVYAMVGGGLVLSAIVSYMISVTPELKSLFYKVTSDGHHVAGMTGFGFIALFLPLVMLLLSGFCNVNRWSAPAVNAYYGVFTASFGVSMYAITSAYTATSVASAFLITAATFGVLAVVGLMTKKPLLGLAAFCSLALVGLVLVMLVSLLFGFHLNQFVINIITVVIFAGLIVVDSQEIKFAYRPEGNSQSDVVYLALSLYLDAMNMFTSILQLTGSKDD